MGKIASNILKLCSQLSIETGKAHYVNLGSEYDGETCILILVDGTEVKDEKGKIKTFVSLEEVEGYLENKS
ncbi:MAG: hypothetical protein ACRC7W_00475 [Fusobacteriaceae bacterium]